MLVDSEGYHYAQHRVSSTCADTIYWRCVYHYKERGSCPARAQTEGFYIKTKSKEHLHKPREPIIKKPHGNTKEAQRLKKAAAARLAEVVKQEDSV